MAGTDPITQAQIEEMYMARLNRGVDPIDMADVDTKATEISSLFPAPRRSNIYDLASDLSAGLAAQAASGQPASIGYGLAGGFNLFSKNEALSRKKADEMKQTIRLKAYEMVESARKEQVSFRKLAAEAGYDYMLEMAKKGGGMFPDTNMDGVSANYLIEAHRKLEEGDDSMIFKPDGTFKERYMFSKGQAQMIKKNYETIDGKTFVSSEEKRDLPFLQQPIARQTIIQDGVTFTFTGDFSPSGSAIYTKPDGTKFELNQN